MGAKKPNRLVCDAPALHQEAGEENVQERMISGGQMGQQESDPGLQQSLPRV